jgi:shikimate dehydrogenase
MRRMELVGRGIAHSASPGMWGRIFGEVSEDVTYGLRDVEETDLPAAIDDLRTGVVDSFHVTMPYKEWAFGVSETYGDDVRITGVANGLNVRDGVIEGVNTDVASARLLLSLAPRRVRSALVLGAGATGASLLLAVTEVAADVYLTNRTPARASRLAGGTWPRPVTVIPWEEREECAREVDLVVNTTPCGLTTSDSRSGSGRADRTPCSTTSSTDASRLRCRCRRPRRGSGRSTGSGICRPMPRRPCRAWGSPRRRRRRCARS